MSKLVEFKNVISRAAGRQGLLIKKHSPELLVAAGIAGIVTSTVLACKATLKAEDVIDEAHSKLEKIKEARDLEDEEKYSEQDYKKDLAIVYTQTGLQFAKLYGPALTLGALSIGCMLTAHGIMKKRNLAMAAAYKAVEQSFADYRKRVIEEFGEEKDRFLKHGITKELLTVEETDKNGKTASKTVEVEKYDSSNYSVYSRFFDEASPHWTKTPEYNLTFLKCQQNYANDLLKSRGHVFLNEVYDMLGIPRSQAGAVVGWVLGEGDDYIDFGMFDGDNMATRDFVNGYERSILLDFNVDGVIYDLI